ncbi:MAG TPA: SLATT domain-containing protein [Ideonella sp.]|uniref:SLATT domain-containing protein n=1 Tax=Ideonella sp. TaxID=1929293 RepID=UPI002CD69A71|nr:SLATT domain-containing protein [Ideonella sp.]HSI49168.1 SLATT domain-containing protein [Ideonella sp.]
MENDVTNKSGDGPLSVSLHDESLRIEEDCTHSAKSHFNAADTWRRRHYWLGIPGTIFAALAGAALIKDYAIAAQLLSVAAAILTGLLTFLKPSDRASQHKQVADQYLSLRNDTRVFRNVRATSLDADEASNRLEALSKRRNDLNQSSPEIPRRAFEAARKGIDEGEATYAVDK